MQNYLFLRFKNQEDEEEFYRSRQRELLFFSKLLLAIRSFFLLILVVTYLSSKSAEGIYLHAIGIAIHIILIGVLITKLPYSYMVHIPLLFLSCSTIVFRGSGSEYHERILTWELVIVISGSVILNQKWLLPSIKTLEQFSDLFIFMFLAIAAYMGLMALELALYTVVLFYFIYFWE